MKRFQGIMYDDSKVFYATREVEGWFGTKEDGTLVFFGDNEFLAKHSVIVANICSECGVEFTDGDDFRLICPSCRKKELDQRFERMEEVAWDGKTPLYDYDSGDYLLDEEDLYRHVTEDCEGEVPRLILCVPESFQTVDYEYLVPYHIGEAEVNVEVLEALDKFNQLLMKSSLNVYGPSDKRVDVSAWFNKEETKTNEQ